MTACVHKSHINSSKIIHLTSSSFFFFFNFPDTSKTTLSPPSANKDKDTKGILKSKSGCVGLFPTDLSSELKSRLKKSTHASVSNLKKSSSTVVETKAPPEITVLQDSAIQATSSSSTESESESDDDDDGVEPGKNLAKILRSVSKASTGDHHHHPHHGDDNTKELLKSLSAAGKMAQSSRSRGDKAAAVADNKVDAPLGSGNVLLSAITNSAVARRRKFNER